MVTIELQRYYGNSAITKSTLTIRDEDGTVLMKCEAREGRYKPYRKGDKVDGLRSLCLGEGEYELIPSSEDENPICLKITHEPSRRGFKICAIKAKYQYKVNRILVGYADSAEDEEFRNLTDIDACRDAFMKVLYQHFLDGFRLVVRNNF